ARIELLQTEVREFVTRDKDPAGGPALAEAVNALGDYQRFLDTELSPKAKGDWRLGAALYAKKFPLALQTSLTPDEAVKRAEKPFQEARQQLMALSYQLHDQLWPKEPKLVGAKKPLPPAEVEKNVNRVRDELSRQHPLANELVEAHGRNLDRLRMFIE